MSSRDHTHGALIFLPQAKWASFSPSSPKVEDIPDLSRKVVIVTGANTGMGYQTAKDVLSHGAKVYVACRSAEKAGRAIERLRQETGKENAVFLRLDLASLKSIKRAAEEFSSKEKQLHILFNNAGLMLPPPDQTTEDGYDLTFGVNVLGHFYFTNLLLPVLLNTAKENPEFKARVVTTASFASEMVSKLDFATFKDEPVRKKTSLEMMYGQSKLANAIFAAELARRYGDQGLVSTAANPGNLETELQRELTKFRRFLVGMILYPAPYGALTQLYAGTSPEGANFNGKYLIPWARIGRPVRPTQDLKLSKDLWEWLEKQVKDV